MRSRRRPALPCPRFSSNFGEPYFRDGERRVIARLLGEPPHVLATGGGAFMDDSHPRRDERAAFTIWLKAPVGLLMARVKKRDTRPLLEGRRHAATPSERLLAIREPVYAKADMTLDMRRRTAWRAL